MKSLVLAMLLSLSLANLEASMTCPKYQCTEADLGRSVCAKLTNDNGINIIEIKDCDDGYQCDMGPFETENIAYCTWAEPSHPKHSNGVPCTYNVDCMSGNCKDGICHRSSLGDACVADADCIVGAHCDKQMCKPLLEKGDHGCKTDDDCEIGLGCQTTSPTNSTCVELFSLNTGTLLVETDSDWICGTGATIPTNTTAEKVCAEPPMSSTTTPVMCATDDDCKMMSGNIAVKGKCMCGLNGDGQSYCTIGLGDPIGKNFLSKFKKWVASDDAKKCNTADRYEYDCYHAYWNKDDAAELRYYELYYKFYPVLYDSKPCARKVTTDIGNSYDAFKAYEEVGDDDFALGLLAIPLVLLNLA